MSDGIIFGVVLFLAYIVISAFFNVAVSDAECHQSCDGEYCVSSASALSPFTPDYSQCEWKEEYVCNSGCGSYGFRCDFDQEYRTQCLACVSQCDKSNASSYSVCVAECSQH